MTWAERTEVDLVDFVWHVPAKVAIEDVPWNALATGHDLFWAQGWRMTDDGDELPQAAWCHRRTAA